MNRSTLRLAGLLVALGVIAYLVMLKPGEMSREAVSGDTLLPIDSALIQRIEIVSSNGSVELERRGIEWRVAAPVDDKADEANIGQALQRASNLRVKSIVSTNPEKHSLFNVDSAGTRVMVTQTDKDPVTFIVGKNSSSFSETYVRADGSQNVALVDGSFPWVFNRPVREWRNRKLLSLTKETVQSMTYRYGDTTFTVSFEDSVWRIGPSQANQTSVNSLVNTLTSLQCDDFLETVPSQRIMAQIEVAGTTVSFVYDSAAKKYNVQLSTSPQWYVMESWRADQILKRRKDLL